MALLDPRVGQVREERRQLVGREHSLVDHGPRGQRREVRRSRRARAVSRSVCLRTQNATRSSSRPASGSRRRRPSVSRCAARKTWRIRGRAASAVAPSPRVDRHVPPAQHLGALDQGVLLQHGDRARPRPRRRSGRKTRPVAYCPAGGSGEVDDRAQERVRHLDHDAGAVAGVGLGAAGAPVVEPAQRRQALGHHVVGAPAGEIGHEGDAAGVMLVGGVVEPLGMRRCHRASCRHVALVSGVGRRRPC